MINPKSKFYFVPYSLELKEPFGTAHGTRDRTDGMLVGIESDDVIGYGEAFMPPYYDENQETMTSFFDLIDVTRLLSFDEISDALKYINELADGNTAAKAAIDIALHDLFGKLHKKSVSDMYGNTNTKAIYTSYTIGIDSIEKMLEKAKKAKDFTILKIKLNGENDVEVISAISAITKQKLFVDANQGWNDVEEAIKISSQLIELGVELIEQPFPKVMLEKTKNLKENTSVPIIADEDVQRKSDIAKLAKYYDGINIKLMKCSGISEGFEMIKTARKHGLKILLGCMTESSIGISAAFQLAGLVDWCDLDGNLLIKNDTCEGVKCIKGQLTSQERNGIGITNETILRKLLKMNQ